MYSSDCKKGSKERARKGQSDMIAYRDSSDGEWNETNELTTTAWMVGYMTMKKTCEVQANVGD